MQLDKFIVSEQKIIYLLLNHKQAIEELLENKITAEFFSERHQFLIDCIYQEYLDSNSTFPKFLTRDSYSHRLKTKLGSDPQILTDLKIFDACIYKVDTTLDDLGTLKIELMNGYAARLSKKALDSFEKIIDAKGAFLASQELIDDLSKITIAGHRKKSTFSMVPELKDEYLKEKKELKENPAKIIKTGITEFDDVMPGGLAPQTLTIIVGDTSSGKTTCMLSIALNIVKNSDTNILFVSLEMGKLKLLDRIISNLSGLDVTKIYQPHQMSKEEFEEMEKSFDLWNGSLKGKFAILDADERISVSMLKREIEIRSMVYKPAVVIVDYIGIVKPEIRYKDRQDIELGEITKDLRFLGKKYGFSTISACQLNREAIRRMRKQKDNLAGSEDLRGSGEISNDADFIFALFPTEESHKLKGQTIKSRYGKSHNTFSLFFDGSRCKIGNYYLPNMMPKEMDTNFGGTFNQLDDLGDMDNDL